MMLPDEPKICRVQLQQHDTLLTVWRGCYKPAVSGRTVLGLPVCAECVAAITR